MSQMLASSNGACDRIYAAQLLIKILKFIGLWQWFKPNLKIDPQWAAMVGVLQFLQRIILHLPITFTFVTLMWIEALRATTMDQAGEVLYMSITEAVMIVKILNIWWHSKKASNFLHELAHYPEYTLRTEEEIKFWQYSQRRFRYVIYLFFTGSILTGVAGFVGVLFLDEYQIPFAYWAPFEWRNNARNFWIVYFYDLVSLYFTMFSNMCLDMMGCYMMFHVSLLYKILSFRLEKLKAAKEEDVNRKLMDLLKFHRSIRKKTQECQSLTSAYVLAQITLSALILCFCFYRILKMNILETVGEFLSMLYFLSVMILEIFLPCYFGNEITVNASHLATDIYSSDWLHFSLATQKNIILFMEFLKRPEQIKAGGYFEVGLPIFTKVINNAYSAFALIVNIGK